MPYYCIFWVLFARWLPVPKGYPAQHHVRFHIFIKEDTQSVKTFPQQRRLKAPLHDQATWQEVLVIGISPKPAYFLVQKNNNILHISHQTLLPII